MRVYVKPLDINDTGLSALDRFAQTQIRMQQLLLKYQAMWALRDIEGEIDASGGIIVIDPKGRIEFKDFTKELIEKISGRLTDDAFESIQ